MFIDLNKHKIINLKKASYELLKEKYPKYENLMERLAVSLQTEADYKLFYSLMIDLYETGFLKAVNDQTKEFKRLNISYTIQPEKSG